MHAGLDFGTSNCSIGIMLNKQPTLIPLEGGKNRLPSCLFIEKDNFPSVNISQAELNGRIAAYKREQSASKKSLAEINSSHTLSEEQLISVVRQQLRKEHRERAVSDKRSQSIVEALNSKSHILFGEEAELTHINEPESGFYIKSPKSFLGADISSAQKVVFTAIVEKMLTYIKHETESIKQTGLNNIVIGRPVNFHGLLGKDGNSQALKIIDEAAKNVGFKEVEFLMEPVAAAFDYERQLTKDKIVLILDLGGGTTDCSVIKIGPSYVHLDERKNCILSHTGQRIGGIDLDNKLALMTIMPHFGKNSLLTNGLPVPNNLFKQAVSVNDVSAQQDFNSLRTQKELARYCTMALDPRLKRLKALSDGKFGLRVSRSAEQAKILLSDQTSIALPLQFIEQDFNVAITRDELSDAVNDELNKFKFLMTEAIRLAGTQPDTLYVTGGTAMSPVVQNWIKSVLPELEIVIGDHFGSVTSGLVTHAERLFS